MLNLLLVNLPQFIHLRRTPRHRPLRNLKSSSQHRACCNRIRSRLRIHLNHANARVLGPTIVRAVFQVAEPGFQRRSVVFTDDFAIGDNFGFAGNGGPFAGGVEEGDVDFGIGLQVIGFAGFGVRVEKEINATAFLYFRFEVSIAQWVGEV